MSDWLRVTRATKCPVCNSDSWCTYTSDGNAVKCMRVQSDNPCESGGWFHFDKQLDVDRTTTAPEPPPRVDAEPLAKEFYEAEEAQWTRFELAEQLGVTVESLELLRVGCGWDTHDGQRFASFPSRDATGKIVGITRRYRDGSKKTFRGTTNGLFYSPNWQKTPGVVLILEGGSDVAAALSMGICAIGRPSNVGGTTEIKQMLAGKNRQVIVVGENDEKPHKRGIHDYCPKDCPGCMHCFPGMYGAKHTANQLGVKYCMPPKCCKDFREMYQNGSVWLDVLKCIS